MTAPFSPDLDTTMQPQVPNDPMRPKAPAIPQTPKAPRVNLPLTPPPATLAPRQADGGPQAPQAPVAPIAPTQQAPAGPGAGVGLVPTDPNRALTSQTIVPGQMADRYAIAQQKFDQFAQSTDPQYQTALKQANRYGAATGRLGSGSLRTDFGNLANQRNQQLDTSREGFLTDALNGSIDDAWRGIGLAERQQGFQQGQQDRAWDQGLDLFGAGNTSNPTNARQYAAETYGAGAGNAAADFWRTLGQRPGVPGSFPQPTPPFNPSAPIPGY